MKDVIIGQEVIYTTSDGGKHLGRVLSASSILGEKIDYITIRPYAGNRSIEMQYVNCELIDPRK